MSQKKKNENQKKHKVKKIRKNETNKTNETNETNEIIEQMRQVVNARTRDKTCARVFTTPAQIFKKFETQANKIVFDYPIKFHEDPSFCCGDICKTILVFV